MEITGRNTTQIREDDLLEAHTEIVRLLNQRTTHGALYQGTQRQRMNKLRDQMAHAIENGDSTPPPGFATFNTPWSVLLVEALR